MVFFSQRFPSHQSSVGSYRLAFTHLLMAMLDSQVGDGCLVLCLKLYLIYISSDSITVINGVISLPVAILAFFFLPDTPGTAKANWVFTERVSTVYS
jgi:hypothetical protein